MDMDNPSKLKLFAKRSDQVICCSEVIAHELKKNWESKIQRCCTILTMAVRSQKMQQKN
ncbi:MAG: hypothetical protein ACLURV_00140 [Gallintestinimicrobium sp.]